jgi:hypothetical protein
MLHNRYNAMQCNVQQFKQSIKSLSHFRVSVHHTLVYHSIKFALVQAKH